MSEPGLASWLQASDALKPAADAVAEQAVPTAKKFTEGQLQPAADKLAKNAVPTAKQVWFMRTILTQLGPGPANTFKKQMITRLGSAALPLYISA